MKKILLTGLACMVMLGTFGRAFALSITPTSIVDPKVKTNFGRI